MKQHPYVERLAADLAQRTDGRKRLVLRTVLKKFGYRKRTEKVIEDVHARFRDGGLNIEFSMTSPPDLEDRVEVCFVDQSLRKALRDSLATEKPGRSSQSVDGPLGSVRNATVTIKAGESRGSGFIIDSSGLVVTNYHVVEDAECIEVVLDDDRHESLLVGFHATLDYAFLWPAGKNWPTVRIGDPTKITEGEEVYAVGCPENLEGTVTKGIVSSTNRQIDRERNNVEYIQTDASINPGNSGGPLVTAEGAVIGINTLRYDYTQDGRPLQGIGFAVPIDYLYSKAKELLAMGRVAALQMELCDSCGRRSEPDVTSCWNCGFLFPQDEAEDDNDEDVEDSSEVQGERGIWAEFLEVFSGGDESLAIEAIKNAIESFGLDAAGCCVEEDGWWQFQCQLLEEDGELKIEYSPIEDQAQPSCEDGPHVIHIEARQVDEDWLLAVWGEVVDIPSDKDRLLPLYRRLLDLNHLSTNTAHFSIDNRVVVALSFRPLKDLDESEVTQMIKDVSELAVQYRERLQDEGFAETTMAREDSF